MDEHETALDVIFELSQALRAAPTTISGQRKSEALLAQLIFQAERLYQAEDDQATDQVVKLLVDILTLLETCAGRHLLYVRQLALLAAANKLLVVTSCSKGVAPEKQKELIATVNAIRKKMASKRVPSKPIVSLALLGAQLTQLESGVVALPIKGEVGRAIASGAKFVVGAAKSFVMMKLDDDLLQGTKELIAQGATAARRQFAKPAFTELLLCDQVSASRKRPQQEDGGISYKELLELRDRHFSKLDSRWELKASVAWSMTEVLVGCEDPHENQTHDARMVQLPSKVWLKRLTCVHTSRSKRTQYRPAGR
mgnify:CR=1 FL=1|jgi:hypothetical protein